MLGKGYLPCILLEGYLPFIPLEGYLPDAQAALRLGLVRELRELLALAQASTSFPPDQLVFTTVTLGSGFLGGEVTPLFFVGAALGSTLARLLGIPLELGAGVGLAATFAASSNTPLARSEP